MSSCTSKRMLLLKATADYSPQIIAHIESVCKLLGVQLVVHEYTDIDAFEAYAETADKFDFIYVAAHGAHHCFGENAGPIARWADFAAVLCKTQLLNDNSVVFMGCCHGGLKKVSLILFSLCDQVSSVCGPRWSVSLGEVPVAIHVFLHNLLTKQLEPEYSAERTAAALGIYFPYYNRYELESEILFMRLHAVGTEPDYTTKRFDDEDVGRSSSASLEHEFDDSCCPMNGTTTTTPDPSSAGA